MLTNPTLEKLKQMKFYGMHRAFEEQLNSSEFETLSFSERMGLLVDREESVRENRRLSARLRAAKLKQQACCEDIDYQQQRGVDKSLIQSLSACQWIKEHLNVLITGPTGTGKTYLACALGHKACLLGFKVQYWRSPHLFRELAVARADGSYSRLISAMAKTDLLIIDDWGLAALTDEERRDLLEILEDRHNLRSTIVVAQLPVEHWHEMIGNPTLADAILDRLVHNAYQINLKGESMLKRRAKKPLPDGNFEV